MHEEYLEPRLVAIYDELNPLGADTDFYLSLPRRSDKTVLDVGCGTGLLAAQFAERGLDVTGVDPSPAMLAVARARSVPTGRRLTWVSGTAADFRLDRPAELAVMTGHVYQLLLDDAATAAALDNIRRNIVRGGRLAFETRNPDHEAWLSWTQHDTMRRVEHPTDGPVDVWVQTDDIDGDLVRLSMHYSFLDTDNVAISRGVLRFSPLEQVLDHVAAAGFQVEEVFGDWNRSPLQTSAPEIIVIAVNATGDP